MVKYISYPQLFGKMMKHAIEFQDGMDGKPDKSYRVVWSCARFKKQVETNTDFYHISRIKIGSTKIVWVSVMGLNKKFKQETKVKALFVLRKGK